MATNNKTQVAFLFERETKRKYRYQEMDPKTGELKDFLECNIGALYVSKSIFNNEPPERIVVTIETV